jgi:hypothetical protein
VVVVNTRFRFPLGGIEGDSTTKTLAVLLIELNLPLLASQVVSFQQLTVSPILINRLARVPMLLRAILATLTTFALSVENPHMPVFAMSFHTQYYHE